jgi:hypothetical protein
MIMRIRKIGPHRFATVMPRTTTAPTGVEIANEPDLREKVRRSLAPSLHNI